MALTDLQAVGFSCRFDVLQAVAAASQDGGSGAALKLVHQLLSETLYVLHDLLARNQPTLALPLTQVLTSRMLHSLFSLFWSQVFSLASHFYSDPFAVHSEHSAAGMAVTEIPAAQKTKPQVMPKNTYMYRLKEMVAESQHAQGTSLTEWATTCQQSA